MSPHEDDKADQGVKTFVDEADQQLEDNQQPRILEGEDRNDGDGEVVEYVLYSTDLEAFLLCKKESRKTDQREGRQYHISVQVSEIPQD